MDFTNKTILITGGTGTFGTAFIGEFLKSNTCKRIRIYSRDEFKQTTLIENSPHRDMLDGFIGDVRDKDRLRRAMEGVDIVFHAAALKQVQSCEYNPFETIKTNIMGSMNVVDTALDAGVEKVLAISTDKAVSPLNLYGATKMCMEKLFVNANAYRGKKKTKICCVRYGNVSGSRGSVIPMWREKIKNGLPVSITNEKATRFWLDIETAIQFVTECIADMDEGSGGDVYVPKIPSFYVKDLYTALCDGHSLDIVGDRPGDKLHETLVSSDEMLHAVDTGRKYILYPQFAKWEYSLPKGDKCNGRKAYSSDSNEQFLTIGEIKARLSCLP